jgi:3-deoxy-D-manno-octulosonic-acid transferase
MMIIYRYLAAPLMLFLLPFAALFNKKIAEGLKLRRQKQAYPEFAQRPVWIHAASGEFEYAKSLIRELKHLAPHCPIVVTYFSPTYARNVKNFPGVDFALPLPLDLPGPVSTFFRRINPRALLMARTDLWPELLTQARQKGIPTCVFSFTQKSPSGLGPIAKYFSRWRLNLVDSIECVSLEDKKNLEELGVATPVRVSGDTRYDQVRFRLDHPKQLPSAWKPPLDTPVMIAGSTWPEDEQVLLPALKPILNSKRLRLILAPHEPTPSHLDDLKRQLDLHGIRFSLFSSEGGWSEAEVLLVDQVGWLAELYAWGDIAFIGGSFKKTVHSVMEALGAGLKTFVGPKHQNNREAIEFQAVRGAVQVVNDVESLRQAVQNLSLEELKSFKQDFQKDFAARLGATKKLAGSVVATLL